MILCLLMFFRCEGLGLGEEGGRGGGLRVG